MNQHIVIQAGGNVAVVFLSRSRAKVLPLQFVLNLGLLFVASCMDKVVWCQEDAILSLHYILTWGGIRRLA